MNAVGDSFDMAEHHRGARVHAEFVRDAHCRQPRRRVALAEADLSSNRVGENLAYAYIEPGSAAIGTAVEIGILGERYAAVVVEPIRYDPDNRLPRS